MQTKNFYQTGPITTTKLSSVSEIHSATLLFTHYPPAPVACLPWY